MWNLLCKLRWAVFLLRFVLRRGRLHAVYRRGRVRFKRQGSFVNRRRLYFEVEPFHGNVFIHNTFFRIETWFPPVAATSFISIGDVTRAWVHHCLELSTRVDIIIGAAAAPIIFSEIRKPCLCCCSCARALFVLACHCRVKWYIFYSWCPICNKWEFHEEIVWWV